jgi:peptide/nickel transport system substrate-binding protein
MRVDSKPFSDPNVRMAMKLIVDRKQMVEQAYSGYGQIANDMPCPGDPGYPKGIAQRAQDIEKAKSLLKAAGYEDLKITINTSAQNGGMTNSAQVFAEQAKKAGVTVDVNIQDAATWTAKHKTDQLKQNYWAAGLIGGAYAQRWTKAGASNDSGWDDADGAAIYASLLKTSDATKQADYAGQLLKRFYDSGPDIIHSFKSNIDLTTDKLKGVIPMQANGWNLGSWRYRLMWLDK